ncbi:PASTA domain-containing protein [Streptomyces sp. NPDC057302]|uniref:PASTA domain-containing protein n=1 Tax=Streptomyces sp. NPDC057302 TaxID=3346094 RepID=UPI00362E14FB
MRTRTTIAALAAAGLLALTGCAAEDTDPESAKPEASQVTDTEKDDGATKDDGAAAAEAETATLPDMTGKGLQAAQDEAQGAGFFLLTSSDATGAGRMQAFDRNWKVCSQTPKAGEHPVETEVEFATVKIDEEC